MSIFDIYHNKSLNITPTFFPKVRSPTDRTLLLSDGSLKLNFSSCDYLGLSNNKEMKRAAITAIREYGTNISGPMIFCGYTRYHEMLEKKLAEIYGVQEGIIYTTSYQANIGVIPVIAQDVDIIVMDKLCHVSLYNAVNISKKSFRVYPHNNLKVLENIIKNNNDKTILIISDGVFSADGDFCDIKGLVKLKETYKNIYLYIDDAHGVGALGKNGLGIIEEENCIDSVDILVGTMSKSYGSTGGFCIVRDSVLAKKIKLNSSTYNASRAVSPGVAAASYMALNIIEREGNKRRSKLNDLVNYAHKKIEKLGINKLNSKSYVIPIVFDSPEKAIEANNHLITSGILSSLFIPPYVEKNKTRLRITISYNHLKKDIDKLCQELTIIKNKGLL
jgi:putative 8-amino-7-oxononanoate synthase/2-amino-3-ketobutyrate coenzyme A ligase